MKKEKGITLVVLVVTIIILLILAGITISQLTGSGLFENSKLAKEKHENAQSKEDDILKQYENAMNGGEISSDRDIDVQQLKEQIKQELMQEISVDACPTGTIIAVMGNSAPEGYLKCDGTVYNISQYQNLANYFGTQFKDNVNNPKINNFGGDGSTTFAVPNLQGEFLRGTGNNGGNVGTHQTQGLPNITGYQNTYVDIGRDGSSGALYAYDDGADYVGTTTSGGTRYNRLMFDASKSNTIYGAAEEVRPTNTSVLYCIKY